MEFTSDRVAVRTTAKPGSPLYVQQTQRMERQVQAKLIIAYESVKEAIDIMVDYGRQTPTHLQMIKNQLLNFATTA